MNKGLVIFSCLFALSIVAIIILQVRKSKAKEQEQKRLIAEQNKFSPNARAMAEAEQVLGGVDMTNGSRIQSQFETASQPKKSCCKACADHS